MVLFNNLNSCPDVQSKSALQKECGRISVVCYNYVIDYIDMLKTSQKSRVLKSRLLMLEKKQGFKNFKIST